MFSPNLLAHEWKESWSKPITSAAMGGMPQEFKECQGPAQDQAWQEFAKALSFTESQWEEKKHDSDGGMNSDGIFSTSKGDSCHKGSKGPKDGDSSVKCFISIFKGKKSIAENRYFGPIKRWKRCDFRSVNGDAVFIAKAVDEIVKKVCRSSSSGKIDWRKTLANRDAKNVDMKSVDVGKAHCSAVSGKGGALASTGSAKGGSTARKSTGSRKKVAKKKQKYRQAVVYYDYGFR